MRVRFFDAYSHQINHTHNYTMKTKDKYEAPQIEILELSPEGVIATSGLTLTYNDPFNEETTW